MSLTLFDSCIYISRKKIEHSKNVLLSAVVLQEMTAGANDKQELKFWEATRKSFEKQNKLLAPNHPQRFDCPHRKTRKCRSRY